MTLPTDPKGDDMSKIPDDVMEAAEAAAERWKFEAAEDYEELRLGFARAIVAERERCAKAAEEAAQDYDSAFRGLTPLNAAAYMHGRAQSVVKAIRNPTP